MKQALAAAIAAKNQTVSRDGYTPNQRLYGQEVRFPGLTDEEERLGFAESIGTEGDVARAHRLRHSARLALLRTDVQDKLRRAIFRRPKKSTEPFIPGTQIYYWIPRKGQRRYASGLWRGPATVLVREGQTRYLVSWRGRCLLLAEENMRLATGEEELALQSPMPEQDLKELARILKDPEGNKGFEDDSNAAAPPKPPPPRMSASRQLLRAQGQAMMRGLRSAKRLLSVLPPTRQNSTKRRKMIADGQRPMALPPPPEAPRERLQLPGVAARALAPPEPDHQPDDVSPVPTTPLDDTQAEPPRVLDEELQNIEVWRRHLLDDVPISVKRKEIPRADPSTDHVHKKLRVAYVFALASMFQGQDAPQNEWLSKYEVAMLKSLTGLEVTSARLHRAPRKRMQVPTKARNRARTSVLIGQDPSVTLVVEENAQEVTMHPKKKAPFLWTGLTIFHREKTHKSHRVYVELPGGLIEAKMHPE